MLRVLTCSLIAIALCACGAEEPDDVARDWTEEANQLAAILEGVNSAEEANEQESRIKESMLELEEIGKRMEALGGEAAAEKLDPAVKDAFTKAAQRLSSAQMKVATLTAGALGDVLKGVVPGSGGPAKLPGGR